MPPLVKPRKLPSEIIADVLDFAEKDALKRHLSAYQKAGFGRNWDEYRRKVDDDLLGKFNQVLSLCRQSGFINPIVRGNKIQWSQVLSPVEVAGECVLCDKSDRDCRGWFVVTERGKEFKPCWERRE